MNNTGTILKLNKKQVIIMTDQGDFIKEKRQPGMFVGQQVVIYKSGLDTIIDYLKNRIKYMPALTGIAAIVTVLMLYFQSPLNPQIFAYIDLDINPSLEFAISTENNVLQVRPFNKDAEELIEGLKLKNIPLETAISQVIQKSKQQGFIRYGQNNIILVSASLEHNENKSKKETADKKLDTVLRSVKTKIEQTNDKELVCKVLKVEPEIKIAASKNNLSLARQAVYIKAQEKDIPITLDEVKTKPISDILRNISIQELDNNSKSGEGDVGSTDRKENTPDTEDNGIISKNTEQKTTHEQAETNETNTEANHKKPNVSNKKTAGGKTRKITVIPSPKTDEDSIETIRKISEPAVTEAPIEQSAPMDLTNKEKEATDRLNSSDIMITPDADIKTSSEQSPNLETNADATKTSSQKPTPSPSPAQSTIDTGINKTSEKEPTPTPGSKSDSNTTTKSEPTPAPTANTGISATPMPSKEPEPTSKPPVRSNTAGSTDKPIDSDNEALKESNDTKSIEQSNGDTNTRTIPETIQDTPTQTNDKASDKTSSSGGTTSKSATVNNNQLINPTR